MPFKLRLRQMISWREKLWQKIWILAFYEQICPITISILMIYSKLYRLYIIQILTQLVFTRNTHYISMIGKKALVIAMSNISCLKNAFGDTHNESSENTLEKRVIKCTFYIASQIFVTGSKDGLLNSQLCKVCASHG